MASHRSGTAVAVAFAGAVALCLPAWHVISELLSDSYMTLYTGRWIAAHGIPHREVFTVVAQGRPWVDQQWLAELIDYRAWRAGGYAGVALLNVAAIGCTFALVAWLMRRLRVSVVLSVSACGLAAVIALPSLFIRAQDLAMPLFAALLALCLADAEHELPRRWLALIVPLLALWANLHGSVLVGSGLAVSYLVYRGGALLRRGKRSPGWMCLALAVLAAAMPLATPYGMHILDYFRDLIGNPAVAAAAPENRPPSLSDPYSLLFFVPLALVALALVKRTPVSVPVLGAVLLTGAATMFASRNVIWSGMTSSVLLAQAAQARLPTREPARRFLFALGGAAAALVALGVALLATRSDGRYEALTPVRDIAAAAKYARQHPCARVLADNPASSALLWHDPRLAGRVAYDARLERYPKPALARWIAFQVGEGPGWRAATRGYQLIVGSSIYNPSLVHRLNGLADTVLARDERGVAVLSGPRCV